MKKVYDEYLFLPQKGKIREKVFVTRMILSVVTIVFCLGMMGFTAYAYFTCTIASGNSVIKSASYEFDLKVTDVTESMLKIDENGGAVFATETVESENAADETTEQETVITPNTEGYFVFDNLVTEENSDVTDKVYEFSLALSKDSTASVGYGKFEVLTDVNEADGSRQIYYTTPIGTYVKDGNTIESKEYKLNLRVPANKTVKVKVIAEWGTCARGPAMADGTLLVPDFVDSKYVHISIDDVTNSLLRLKDTEYTSLYDEPFFAWLKNLHDSYGAKFSLYACVNVLEQVPDTYKAEFTEAKDWLKIGLHAEDSGSNYGDGNLTHDNGVVIWKQFAENVFRITGTYESVDRMPKLEGSAGSEEVLKGMKHAVSDSGDKYGAIGFLADKIQADGQVQNVYYLKADTDADAIKTLFTDDIYIDRFDVGNTVNTTNNDESLNGFVFVSTDIVFGELDADPVKRQEQYEVAASMHSCIALLHEGQIYDENGFIADADGNTEFLKSQVEELCKFANEKGIKFNYPQTRNFDAIQALKDAEKTALEAAEKAAKEAAEKAVKGATEKATQETADKVTEDTTTGTSQESANVTSQKNNSDTSQGTTDQGQEEGRLLLPFEIY